MPKTTVAQLEAKLVALQAQVDSELEAKVGLEQRVDELEKALATTEAQVRPLRSVPTSGKPVDSCVYCKREGVDLGHRTTDAVMAHRAAIKAAKAS